MIGLVIAKILKSVRIVYDLFGPSKFHVHLQCLNANACVFSNFNLASRHFPQEEDPSRGLLWVL